MKNSSYFPTFRFLTSGRFWKRFLFTAACLATVIALFYTEENIRGKLAWDRYIREQTAKGEPLTLKELMPPPVPDEQNFAMCPLLKPIFDVERQADAPGSAPEVAGDTNALARMDLWNPWQYLRQHFRSMSRDDPSRKLKPIADRLLAEARNQTNGWANLAAWAAAFRLDTNLVGAPVDLTVPEIVRQGLRYADADLAELKRFAAERPKDRWPIAYENPNPVVILLPHLARMKALVSLIVLRAEAALAAGDTEAALADWRLGWRVTETLREEPLLISLLVRLACHKLLMQPLREGFARHQLNEEQLRALQERLAQADILEHGALSLRGERSFGVGIAEMLRKHPEELVYLTGTGEGPMGMAALRFIPSGWIQQNALRLCQLHDRYGLPALDLKARRVHTEIADGLEEATSAAKPPYGVLAGLLMPALGKAIQRVAEGQVLLDQAVLACALERYHLAHGAYPPKLDALVPEILPELPHDVLTGQPFHYRTDESGRYQLWSVAWDGKDDGGRPVPPGERYKPDGGWDWVWTLPDPAEQPY